MFLGSVCFYFLVTVVTSLYIKPGKKFHIFKYCFVCYRNNFSEHKSADVVLNELSKEKLDHYYESTEDKLIDSVESKATASGKRI